MGEEKEKEDNKKINGERWHLLKISENKKMAKETSGKMNERKRGRTERLTFIEKKIIKREWKMKNVKKINI